MARGEGGGRVTFAIKPSTSICNCQGCAKSSGSSELFYSREAKPYKHTRQHVYNKSLLTHRVIPSTFHIVNLCNINQSMAVMSHCLSNMALTVIQ